MSAGVVAAVALSGALTDCDTGLGAGAVAIGRLVVVPVLIVVNVVAFALVFSVVYRGVASRVGAAVALLATLLCLAFLAWPTVALYLSENSAALVCEGGWPSRNVDASARELVPAESMWHYPTVTKFVVIIIDERAG